MPVAIAANTDPLSDASLAAELAADAEADVREVDAEGWALDDEGQPPVTDQDGANIDIDMSPETPVDEAEAIDAAFSPEDGDEGEGTEVEAERKAVDADGTSRGSRAKNRIRSLAKANSEMKARLAQMEEQSQQQAQFLYQKIQALESEKGGHTAQLLAKMTNLLESAASPRVDVEKLSPVDRLKHELKQELKRENDAELAKLQQSHEARLNQLSQSLAQRDAERDRAVRGQTLKAKAEAALKNVLLKDLDPATAARLGPKMEEMLLAWSGAFGQYPDQAAPEFRATLEAFASAVVAAKGAKNKQVRGKQGATRAVPRASAAAGVKPKLTYDEAIKSGGDLLSAMSRQIRAQGF